jgi:hypothetical protein
MDVERGLAGTMKLLTAAFAVCFLALLFAAPVQGRPGQTQTQAFRAEQPPTIDGTLDDACWQRPPDAVDFWYNEMGVLASERTEAWICYDDANIYVAFRCFDSNPNGIAASQRKRGGSLRSDDYVRFDIDPWHSHRRRFQFFVNPIGTQNENMPGGGGTKIEWIGDWEAAAARNGSGWTAEMAIPWSMLSYPSGQETMGVMFVRRRAASDQIWQSPNLGPNNDLSLMLGWTGLLPPKPKLSRTILHHAIAGFGGVGLQNGLDMKQQLSQETNALITINPDFDSVEQSVESIDFTYSPRVLSDNRPFFAEGATHFAHENQVFYSRSIEDVDIGAKVVGQTGRHDYSGLFTRAGGGDRHLFYKSRWSLGTDSRIGIATTSTRAAGVDNNVGAVHFRLGRQNSVRRDRFEGRVLKSWTEGDGGDGVAYALGLHGQGGPRQLGYGLWYLDYHPDYYPADGIVPEPDRKGWYRSLEYGDLYDSGWLRGWQVELDNSEYDLQSGDLLSRSTSLSVGFWSLTSQYNLRYHSGKRRGWEPDESGSVPIFHDRLVSMGWSWHPNDMYRRGYISASFGSRAGGDYLGLLVRQGFSLFEFLHSDLTVEYVRMTGPYAHKARQTVLTMSYDITSERSLSARLVERSGTLNPTLGFRQAVRRGQDIYVLFGDPNADGTVNRVIVKLIRPLF